MQPSVTHGYIHLTLCRDGIKENWRLHRLVLEAFCGPPPFDGAEAAHNDGDKLNCNLTNLRWANKIENQADVDRHGRRCRGEAVFGAVLTERDIRDIRVMINMGLRNPEIAKNYSVSISTIHLIRHNKTWKHVT